jgi:hypothetical protein
MLKPDLRDNKAIHKDINVDSINAESLNRMMRYLGMDGDKSTVE